MKSDSKRRSVGEPKSTQPFWGQPGQQVRLGQDKAPLDGSSRSPGASMLAGRRLPLYTPVN